MGAPALAFAGCGLRGELLQELGCDGPDGAGDGTTQSSSGQEQALAAGQAWTGHGISTGSWWAFGQPAGSLSTLTPGRRSTPGCDKPSTGGGIPAVHAMCEPGAGDDGAMSGDTGAAG